MTTVLFVRRFLADYARNPVNLLVLVTVPVVFVIVAAGAMADAAALLGGAGGGPAVETATAGWAAGFLAALAMYFQLSSARAPDRRLVISGLPARQFVACRLLAGLALAVLVSAVALLALAARTGLTNPGRVAAGTLMFALIYLGIGAVVGATIRNPVNGTVVIMFIWIIDVFFGPTLSAGDKVFTRFLPTHFVSLWMVDVPSTHAGTLGDMGWGLAWTILAVVAAFTAVYASVRVARPYRTRRRPGSVRDQLHAALRMGWHDWRRNPVLWVLLVVVPVVFILLSDWITPHGSTPVTLVEDGLASVQLLDPAHFHAATMAPSGVAALATLAGLFVILDAREGDRRLVLAGMRVGVVLTSRLAVVFGAALLAAAVSLVITALVFGAHNWAVYATATVLIAITYGLVGVLLGPIFGRVAGVFIAFLVPFLDLAIGQSPMLKAEPAPWAQYLPGYGGIRVLIDGALTSGFDEGRALLISLGWIVILLVAAIVTFRHVARAS